MAKTPTSKPQPRPAPAAQRPQAPKPAQPQRTQQPAPQQARPAPQAQRPAPQPQPQPQRLTVPATVQRQQGELAVVGMDAPLPAYMQADVGMGIENIGREDLEIPRLKLMAATSKELTLYDGLRAGNFFHTATEQVFAGSTRVTPIYYEKCYLLWRPLDDGGGILARADDSIHWKPADAEFTVTLDKKDGGGQVTWKTAATVAESGLADWGTMNPEDENSPPAATLMYNYVFAFPDHPDQISAVFSFSRSGLKAGKRFNTKLRTVRAPMFGLIFDLSSFLDRNKEGKEFFNVQITGAGRIDDEGLYNEYKKLHEGFAANGLIIKDEASIQEEVVGDPVVDNTDDAGDGAQQRRY